MCRGSAVSRLAYLDLIPHRIVGAHASCQVTYAAGGDNIRGWMRSLPHLYSALGTLHIARTSPMDKLKEQCCGMALDSYVAVPTNLTTIQLLQADSEKHLFLSICCGPQPGAHSRVWERCTMHSERRYQTARVSP